VEDSRFKLPDSLTADEQRIRVNVSQIMGSLVEGAQDVTQGRSVTPGQSKNYFEFLELVHKAIEDYQNRQKPPFNRRVNLSWERPNLKEETERITISLEERMPGAFSEGAPREGKIKNLRPILREKRQSETDPGYLTAIFGKWYDNLIGFTTWAQTNKEAIERAFWFEDFMEKYTWFFRASGVGRVLFYSQKEDEFTDNDGQRLYGRRLTYFVRTERITTIDEKTLENIYLNLSVGL